MFFCNESDEIPSESVIKSTSSCDNINNSSQFPTISTFSSTSVTVSSTSVQRINNSDESRTYRWQRHRRSASTSLYSQISSLPGPCCAVLCSAVLCCVCSAVNRRASSAVRSVSERQSSSTLSWRRCRLISTSTRFLPSPPISEIKIKISYSRISIGDDKYRWKEEQERARCKR